MKRGFMVLGTLIAALCLLVGPARTQTFYGKIAGQVTDADGGALPGANVVVDGTRFGATSDSDGYYAIIGVEPGFYTLKASMVGYEARCKVAGACQGGRRPDNRVRFHAPGIGAGSRGDCGQGGAAPRGGGPDLQRDEDLFAGDRTGTHHQGRQGTPAVRRRHERERQSRQRRTHPSYELLFNARGADLDLRRHRVDEPGHVAADGCPAVYEPAGNGRG